MKMSSLNFIHPDIGKVYLPIYFILISLYYFYTNLQLEVDN